LQVALANGVTGLSATSPNVRFWHKADLAIALSNFRFGGKADIPFNPRNVCF
jgi:hypothetical protein